jgi:ABC-2 type transport system ATP-binding protein
MDEPTNGLDIPSKKRFRKLISSSMRDDRIIFISTHQTRDLENLIDQVVIVDNGELVLNAPVEVINQKLSFKIVEENYNEQPVFYEEELLKGRAVIIENTDGIESQINLEQLFNAATENPVMVKAVFNK